MLSEITSATFRNPATGASYSLEELGGQLVSCGKSVDLQHPLIPVLFQINNTKDWIPGAFVELYIRTQGSQPVITVPRKAILEEMGNHFVYVQLTPEYFEKRQVNIGRTDGARTEILSGLNGSERVVVNGATNVRRVRSASMFGFSFVWAEFNWGMDVFKARQIVSEKMVALSGTLPEGIMPQLAPQSSIMGEILLIGMQADSTSMMDLRTLADWVIKPAILATGGVSQVTIIGGDYKQYLILADPQKLDAYGITMADLEQVGKTFSNNSEGGVIRDFGNEYALRGMARTTDLDELGATFIKRVNGCPVRVSDVAEVVVGSAVKMGTACLKELSSSSSSCFCS